MIRNRTHAALVFALPILLLLCLSRLAGAQAPKTEPLPTMPELQKLYAEKQWQPLLQGISRILPLRGAAAQPYDRYELFTMKGEAHLALKQQPAAGAAFEEASKVEAIDKVKKATADSMVLLVKRSQQGQFTRKSPTSQPSEPKTFDLLDQSKRKDAFAALAADELAALQPKAKAASSGTSLRPIADLLKSLDNLKQAEMAASASNDTPLADGLVAPLASRAKDLSSKEVAQQKAKVDSIESAANQVVDVPDRSRAGRGYPGAGAGAGAGTGSTYPERRYKKRGLQGMDQQTLKQIMGYCQDISTADKQLAEVFGDPGQPLLDVAKDADTLATKAQTILNTDYSITTSDPRGLK
jgi:hypothetical protein